MFAVEVDRYFRVRPPTEDDLPFPIDNDGFLNADAPITHGVAELAIGDILPSQTAAGAHALVLLGEPGLGKTTAIRAIVRQIPGAWDKVTWLDGSDLDDDTFDAQLGAALAALPQLEADAARPRFGAGREPAMTLVLDQLDESAMLRRLPKALRKQFADRDTSALQLFVACRTADMPTGLRELLEATFEPYVIADLAPLRRVDAVTLATSTGVDGEALVTEAVNSAAGILAAVPLTLGLLVRAYQETGGLEGGARELFARGATHLLGEPDAERFHEQTSTLDQRIAVAERIAAALLLSGRRTIWQGRDLGSADVDLEPRIVVGGTERTSAGEFEVSKVIVNEVLATPMFSGRGDVRLAFTHSSYAAFLAARHLRERALPRRQLEGLFLVAGPDGSRTIPAPLRETAAWLATLDEVTGRWLATADPEGLVGHDRVLESDDLRKVVVDELLMRAEEYELGGRSWKPDPRLSHPGIAVQLLDVLNTYESQPEWPAFARCRLALRLAMQARSPALAEKLLQLVESEEFNAHLRSLAAEAALANDPALAIPRLRALLARFADPDFGRAWDGDDELKGNLLDELWPEHVTLGEILPLLRPRRTTNLLGAYWMFLRQFVTQLRVEDITEVLHWAYDRATAAPPAATERDGDDVLSDDRPIGQLDGTIIEALIERSLGFDDISGVADGVAELLRHQVRRHNHMPMPEALDETLLEGQKRDTAGAKRLALAEALIRAIARSKTFDRADAWHVVYDWRPVHHLQNSGGEPQRGRLLDATDLEWALELAIRLDAAGEEDVARAAAQVAETLFNPQNRDAIEIASRQEGTVNWEFIGRWFEAIRIDSKQADDLREHQRLEMELARDDDDEVESQNPQVASDLVAWLERAVAGDTGIFWLLAHNLQFPLDTGRGRPRLDDRLLDFPGVTALGDDAPKKLLDAGRQYLLAEHDHADKWLGTDRYDWRAWAGYLALVLLNERGELTSIPSHRLASWAGAITWFHAIPSNGGNEGTKRRLLQHAAQSVPVRLAHMIRLYTRGELSRGGLASELECVDPGDDPYLASVWAELVNELEAALKAPPRVQPSSNGARGAIRSVGGEQRERLQGAWATMLDAQARAFPETVEEAVSRAVESAHTEAARDIATVGVEVLLRHRPDAWRRLLPSLRDDPALGRQLATRIASGHRGAGFMAELTEEELAELYLWLADLFVPEGETMQLDAHFVTPNEQARRWRDDVLTAIANRESDDAVRVLHNLREQFPLRTIILSNLLRARINRFATAWVPPSPEDVQLLLADADRRLVRSTGELASLIEEALIDAADDMNHTGELLWNRAKTARGAPEKWTPKPEAALQTYLAHDLGLRLHGRALAVNREVLVKPTNAYGAGDSTDILIEATVTDDAHRGVQAQRLRVVIEVKCAFNAKVLTDQRTQLAERYLPEAQAGAGIYAVGWYPLDLWDPADQNKRSRVPTDTAEALAAVLEEQAQKLRDEGKAVRSVVLVIPRPAPTT